MWKALNAALIAGILVIAGLGYHQDRAAARALAESYTGAPGAEVPDLRLRPLSGPGTSLSSFQHEEWIVILFRDSDCPASMELFEAVRAIEAEYTRDGIVFLYLQVSGQPSRRELARELEGPISRRVIMDRHRRLAGQLRAESAVDILIMNSERKLLHLGPVSGGAEWTNSLREHLDRLVTGEPLPAPERRGPALCPM